MCQPISLNSDGKGNVFCFPWDLRLKIYKGELESYEPDSHTSIAYFYGFKGSAEDRLNKWEYDFSTGTLIVDQINTVDDWEIVKAFLDEVGPEYFYPQSEVSKVTQIIGDLHITGIPLVWESLTEVNGSVWATNCQFPVLTEVKGYVKITNCDIPARFKHGNQDTES